MFKETTVYDLDFNVFQEINKNWMLVSAKNAEGASNALTASWGAMGELWGTETATIYIRQSRFTKEFIDASDYFTLSLFDEHRDELLVMGTTSGRDCDKAAKAGLTVVDVDGQPAFAEAKAVIICKKAYEMPITMESMSDELVEKWYSGNDAGDFHTMYIGQIVGCYINE